MPGPRTLACCVVLALSAALPVADLGAQTSGAAADSTRRWYDRLSLRGYTQVRYEHAARVSGEGSLDPSTGFLLRRVRLVLSGDVSDRVSVYIQPDFASSVGGSLHVGQLRDAYFDVALDRAKAFRVRVGQSKIPFGWENLQSSSNRLSLERNVALASAFSSERDVATLLYWSPSHVRQRLRALTDSGLKGSGDYGMVALGVFNGQGTNRADVDDDLHAVARVTYPFRVGGRYVEVGVQGYAGRYQLAESLRPTGTADPGALADRRVAATFVLYPQPFGLQAEWTTGRGPSADSTSGTVRERGLEGGYVQAMDRHRARGQVVVPFVRAQRFDGGLKFERGARHDRLREIEAGVEWLPFAALELTATYSAVDRRSEDLAGADDRRRARLLRLQAQFNY